MSKSRKLGQWAQGNKLYLTAYQKQTRKCRKILIDYAKSEFGIDSDNDKLALIWESEPVMFFRKAAQEKASKLLNPGAGLSGQQKEKDKEGKISKYYIFAVYDLQRILLI